MNKKMAVVVVAAVEGGDTNMNEGGDNKDDDDDGGLVNKSSSSSLHDVIYCPQFITQTYKGTYVMMCVFLYVVILIKKSSFL